MFLNNCLDKLSLYLHTIVKHSFCGFAISVMTFSGIGRCLVIQKILYIIKTALYSHIFVCKYKAENRI